MFFERPENPTPAIKKLPSFFPERRLLNLNVNKE